jgi:hypothetical protein
MILATLLFAAAALAVIMAGGGTVEALSPTIVVQPH